MAVTKCIALAFTLACCNLAMAQQQQQADQSRRSERVEERRDQFNQNRENRQENRDARQAERAGEGRQFGAVAERIGTALDSSMGKSMDEFIASCLLLGNQEEVALAQEAVSRAQNESVKQFAQTLIDDHQKAIQKLQQYAKQGIGLGGAVNVAVSARAQGDQIASNQLPTAQQHTVNRVNIDHDPLANAGALDQVLKMHQQAAQECLTMTKAIMQEKQGAEFDKAFTGSQIGAHVGMLAKLKASQQHASPELAAIIQESEQIVQQHLEHAKQLCEELEGMQVSTNR